MPDDDIITILGAFLAAGALSAWGVLTWIDRQIRKRAEKLRDVGLSLVLDDPTDLDDAELAEAMAERGMVPEISQPPIRPHTECVNHWFDGEPHRVHSACRAAIEAARR